MNEAKNKAKGKRASGKAPGKAPAPASARFAPRKVVIMYRPGTTAAIKLGKDLSKRLQQKGLRVFAAPEQKLNAKDPVVDSKTIKEIDWVIVLGGDGTYLRAVQMLEGRQVPILGINMGGLGFLTETRLADLDTAVEATLAGKMTLLPRSMLRVEVRRGGRVISSHVALNDAVLERGAGTHLINIEIFSQKHFVANVKADALVVASPTGSTAYNLAAGGPILHPDVRAIVVTPVCPHALTSRPLIFPDDQQLAFKVNVRDKTAILSVDGIKCGEILFEDEVRVVRNTVNHLVIRRPTANYFSLLREKLAFGQRD